ncbi:hypothetical protein OG458_42290 (plasmid) [Streptomyces sp. NBC_01281]|uniref:hypothetical protein n=1 Tax=Streptomyces sp. NBC_01281 TaxID=2903811 RepID=UPI002E0D0E7F|nr:hypothetical protein OG458_41515 [Streptomyces sp. NBC_01281]WSK66587.1 hypothetical protein OG458_42290 [Streptomyces sp. NBC_01281]
MTTAVTRPLTVTTRIGAPAHPAAPAAPDVFTATVYLNTHPNNLDRYEPHHPLAAATQPDGTLLRLVFRSSDRVRNHQDAAAAAFHVGTHHAADDTGQTWPGDIRPVSVGDVIKIVGPGHWIIHLRVASSGFFAVAEPTILTGLAGKTRVTSRR